MALRADRAAGYVGAGGSSGRPSNPKEEAPRTQSPSSRITCTTVADSEPDVNSAVSVAHQVADQLELALPRLMEQSLERLEARLVERVEAALCEQLQKFTSFLHDLSEPLEPPSPPTPCWREKKERPAATKTVDRLISEYDSGSTTGRPTWLPAGLVHRERSRFARRKTTALTWDFESPLAPLGLDALDQGAPHRTYVGYTRRCESLPELPELQPHSPRTSVVSLPVNGLQLLESDVVHRRHIKSGGRRANSHPLSDGLTPHKISPARPAGRRASTSSGTWQRRPSSENAMAECRNAEAKQHIAKSSARAELRQSIGKSHDVELLQQHEEVRAPETHEDINLEHCPSLGSTTDFDDDRMQNLGLTFGSLPTLASENSLERFDSGGSERSACGELVRVSSPLLHRICGLLPWHCSGRGMCDTASGLYQRAVLFLVAGAVVVSAENFVTLQRADASWGGGTYIRAQELADFVVALGSFLGLVSARHLGEGSLVGHDHAPLVNYAQREHLVATWSRVSSWQSGVLVLLWGLVTAVRCMAPIDPPGGLPVAVELRRRVSLAVFAFTSGLLLVLVHSVLHVVGLLPLTLDAFCSHLQEEHCLESNVHDWNLLQALLRRASRVVERTFVRVQFTAFVVVLVGATKMALSLHPEMHVWLLVVGLLLGAGCLWLFFRAAEITEKCSQVPPLVNSLSSGVNVDAQRHFLVEHISYSSAGFYVNEVRLSASTATKIVYTSCVIAYALFTKVASAC